MITINHEISITRKQAEIMLDADPDLTPAERSMMKLSGYFKLRGRDYRINSIGVIHCHYKNAKCTQSLSRTFPALCDEICGDEIEQLLRDGVI